MEFITLLFQNPSADGDHPLIGPQQAALRMDFGGRLQHPRGEILTLEGKMSLERPIATGNVKQRTNTMQHGFSVDLNDP